MTNLIISIVFAIGLYYGYTLIENSFSQMFYASMCLLIIAPVMINYLTNLLIYKLRTMANMQTEKEQSVEKSRKFATDTDLRKHKESYQPKTRKPKEAPVKPEPVTEGEGYYSKSKKQKAKSNVINYSQKKSNYSKKKSNETSNTKLPKEYEDTKLIFSTLLKAKSLKRANILSFIREIDKKLGENLLKYENYEYENDVHSIYVKLRCPDLTPKDYVDLQSFLLSSIEIDDMTKPMEKEVK